MILVLISEVAARGKVESFDASITAIDEKINGAKAEKEEFETQWRLLANEQPWSRELLEKEESVLNEAEENLAQAKQEIDSARGALITARLAEAKERDRASRQHQLVELNTRLRELEAIEELRSQCVNGVEALQSAKDAFIKKQIQPLCDVITAIFVPRVQHSLIE